MQTLRGTDWVLGMMNYGYGTLTYNKVYILASSYLEVLPATPDESSLEPDTAQGDVSKNWVSEFRACLPSQQTQRIA